MTRTTEPDVTSLRVRLAQLSLDVGAWIRDASVAAAVAPPVDGPELAEILDRMAGALSCAAVGLRQ